MRSLAYLCILALLVFVVSCAGDDDGGGGSSSGGNASPTLAMAIPIGGDVSLDGTAPAQTGICFVGDDLALEFAATDADSGDTLTTTISITGGSLSASLAGFAESFPYAPAGSTSTHTVSLSGTAEHAGLILLSIDVVDGMGGSEQITLALTIRTRPGFDFNGDGFADVLVGARTDDDGGTDSGAAFIFFGSATPAASIDASAADVTLVGGDGSDLFGNSVAPAGDVNNDGYDDVIVGAQWDDDGGAESGSAFIFFGAQTPASTVDASAANVTLVGGDPDDRFSFSVSSAGDVNGDGFGDVIVGASLDDDGGSSSGSAFVFFGGSAMAATIDSTSANVTLVGADIDDQFGYGVTGGDFNGDGYSDMAVSARLDDDGGTDSGTALIFYGGTSIAANIDASAADVTYVGVDSTDNFGYAISSSDFNGDNLCDIVVGAYWADDGGTDSGAAYVFLGATNLNATIDASTADMTLIGADAGDKFGETVTGAGDINGDGFDDILVGARWDDDGGTDAGTSFLFLGGTSLASSVDASLAYVKFVGTSAGDWFGNSVAAAGDLDNDGYDDIIIGAFADDNGGTDSGVAFIFQGSNSLASTILATSADTTLVGADAGDKFGDSVG